MGEGLPAATLLARCALPAPSRLAFRSHACQQALAVPNKPRGHPTGSCRAHFEEHALFGLSPAQVTFFQQGWLPCLTEEGRIIMESSSSVSGLAPRATRHGPSVPCCTPGRHGPSVPCCTPGQLLRSLSRLRSAAPRCTLAAWAGNTQLHTICPPPPNHATHTLLTHHSLLPPSTL
jgi:hypothetical protein